MRIAAATVLAALALIAGCSHVAALQQPTMWNAAAIVIVVLALTLSFRMFTQAATP